MVFHASKGGLKSRKDFWNGFHHFRRPVGPSHKPSVLISVVFFSINCVSCLKGDVKSCKVFLKPLIEFLNASEHLKYFISLISALLGVILQYLCFKNV